ncbi:MAG: ABC transporter permease [Armatimonadaceae bacterium]|jgi:ABC-type dipeptide/oligopeptide/nickel transport system permease subunit
MTPRETWQRIAANKIALASIIFLALLILAAAFVPMLLPFGYEQQLPDSRLLPPGGKHILGTDDLGRDILTRVLVGARISLMVAVSVECVVVFLGLTVGLIAGYRGGWIDSLLMRITDVLLAFPDVLLAILLLGTLGATSSRPETSAMLVVISLGVTGWPPLARLVRGQVVALRQREFVDAARSIGSGHGRILLHHILPNLVSPIIVAVTVDAAGVILAEATLSYLGIGVQRPMPSWGRMINDALDYYKSEPRLVIVPATMLSLTVIALNFLGDGLRDALDPRKTRR